MYKGRRITSKSWRSVAKSLISFWTTEADAWAGGGGGMKEDGVGEGVYLRRVE
jgi:hypothetical protein